jgi:hypothetical protein
MEQCCDSHENNSSLLNQSDSDSNSEIELGTQLRHCDHHHDHIIDGSPEVIDDSNQGFRNNSGIEMADIESSDDDEDVEIQVPR